MRAAGTWDDEGRGPVPAACVPHGVSCGPTLHVQDNEIVKVTAPADGTVPHGSLCSKGRFGYQLVQNRD
ncbi:putative molibdopterin-dependent oxidoreductase YjgC [Streptomyces sp. SAI-041]|nr:putative molibdopterin-dependent oxidoreductase YjgC [Streptomyces sp. SAI-041]